MLWHVLAVLMGWVVTKLCVFWFVPKCVHRAHSCWFEWETRNTCKKCECMCMYLYFYVPACVVSLLRLWMILISVHILKPCFYYQRKGGKSGKNKNSSIIIKYSPEFFTWSLKNILLQDTCTPKYGSMLFGNK